MKAPKPRVENHTKSHHFFILQKIMFELLDTTYTVQINYLYRHDANMTLTNRTGEELLQTGNLTGQWK